MDSYNTERWARAYLMGVTEEPGLAVKAFVALVGPVQAAARVRKGDVPDDVAGETCERRERVSVDGYFAIAESYGDRLVIPEDSEWPGQVLSALGQVDLNGERAGIPLGLWARGTGRVADLLERAVTVVGSRAATSYGLMVGGDLGHDLARAGVTVVSGVGFGIAESVQREVVAVEGEQVAVLAHGLSIDHAANSRGLIRAIAGKGLVLSEYAPDRGPSLGRVVGCNRLVACLGAGTVVVEAGLRSGSHNAAKAAAALGRVVMAVPGQVTSPQSAGCHQLLRSGDAVAVTSAAEVLESCGLAPRPALGS